jgi:hypothetical protein
MFACKQVAVEQALVKWVQLRINYFLPAKLTVFAIYTSQQLFFEKNLRCFLVEHVRATIDVYNWLCEFRLYDFVQLYSC